MLRTLNSNKSQINNFSIHYLDLSYVVFGTSITTLYRHQNLDKISKLVNPLLFLRLFCIFHFSPLPFPQTGEISNWQRRVAEMQNRVGELEENLAKAQKELLKAQDANSKLQRDLRENVAQKEDQEERIATLEKRYLNAQRESTSLHDLNEKLEQELQHKEAQIKVGF